MATERGRIHLVVLAFDKTIAGEPSKARGYCHTDGMRRPYWGDFPKSNVDSIASYDEALTGEDTQTIRCVAGRRVVAVQPMKAANRSNRETGTHLGHKHDIPREEDNVYHSQMISRDNPVSGPVEELYQQAPASCATEKSR
jgi:hypothetical protein